MRVTSPRRSASCSRSRLVRLKGWLVGAILLHMACGECAAWYRAGHWGVAYLAWRGLDGTERRVELVELLRRHPHAESFLRADRPEGVDPDEWMFVQAANWPDWVAAPTGPGISEAEGAGIRRTYYRPAGHFVNLPIVHPDDKRTDERDLGDALLKPREGAVDEPKHAVEALRHWVEVLNDREADGTSRAIALCWVLHVTGDVHQPLHAATLVASKEAVPPAGFELPAGDQGGNLIAVRIDEAGGESTTLHRLWDRLALGEEPYVRARELIEGWSREPDTHRLAEEAARIGFAPEEWARESHRLAKECAYRDRGAFLRVSPIPAGVNPTGNTDGTLLSREYLDGARRVSARRLSVAGRRLTGVLRQD